MGTVIQKRIMTAYETNKHEDTPPLKNILAKQYERLHKEQQDREAKRKAELIERFKRIQKAEERKK